MIRFSSLVAASLLATGCQLFAGHADPDRAMARATLLTVAKAVDTADTICAQYARASKDAVTARKCMDAYNVAFRALTAAEYGIDAWDEAGKGSVACSVLEGARSLKEIGAALESVKIALPAIAKDVERLVTQFEGVCRG